MAQNGRRIQNTFLEQVHALSLSSKNSRWILAHLNWACPCLEKETHCWKPHDDLPMRPSIVANKPRPKPSCSPCAMTWMPRRTTASPHPVEIGCAPSGCTSGRCRGASRYSDINTSNPCTHWLNVRGLFRSFGATLNMGVSLSTLDRIETEYDWGEESCSRDATLIIPGPYLWF